MGLLFKSIWMPVILFQDLLAGWEVFDVPDHKIKHIDLSSSNLFPFLLKSSLIPGSESSSSIFEKSNCDCEVGYHKLNRTGVPVLPSTLIFRKKSLNRTEGTPMDGRFNTHALTIGNDKGRKSHQIMHQVLFHGCLIF
jgi:hypothetical protein